MWKVLLVENLLHESVSQPTVNAKDDYVPMSEDILRALDFIIGPGDLLEKAIEIVVANKVVEVQGMPSRRTIHIVTSSAKKSEHVFYISSSDHCTCPAFMHSIKADPTSLGCKHIIAVLIGKYTNSLRKLTVSDDDLVDKYMCVNDLQELAGTR